MIITLLGGSPALDAPVEEGCRAWWGGASVKNRVHQLPLTIFISTTLLSFEAFGKYLLTVVFIPKNEGVILLDAADRIFIECYVSLE